MGIDVANVSDDVYFDRRSLRDSLNNNSTSSSSSSDSPPTYDLTNSTPNRLNSSNTSSSSNNNNRSPTPPTIHNNNNNNNKVQQDQIVVDIPNFRDIVQNTSELRLAAVDSRTADYKKFIKKDTLDGSHLDWEGDCDTTVGSGGAGKMKEISRKDEKKTKTKGVAIIVHDDDDKERGGRREGSTSSSNRTRRTSLGLDMPIFSKVSRKSSRTFESIWGATGNTTDEDSMYSNSAGSKERKFAMKNCVYGMKSHGKMILLCIMISVVLSAGIGVLIAMIPIWIQSEERGESAEVGGGLAYGEGDGVLMDSSSGSSSSSGVLVASEEEDAPTAASKLVLTPPPYDLDHVCKQETLLEEGGYDTCVSACFPSRCCLVDESQTYEVWTLHIGANDIEEIGKSIPSCFKDHKDTCMKYNQACSILGEQALLPVKPPSSKEVLAMNNVEKLQLAETIIWACSPRIEGSREGLAECQALCEAKACCFVEDIEEDESPVRVTDTGASSILEIPPANNLEEGEVPPTSENSGRKVQITKYCGDDPQQFCLTYAGCETYFQNE